MPELFHFVLIFSTGHFAIIKLESDVIIYVVLITKSLYSAEIFENTYNFLLKIYSDSRRRACVWFQKYPPSTSFAIGGRVSN